MPAPALRRLSRLLASAMPSPTRSTVRFAAALAVAGALFGSGLVAGAAGASLIIGSSTNNAGTSNTVLTTNSSVVAFQLLQNGPGTALFGYATPASGGTRGVYGRSNSPNGDGVQARNAGTQGGGAGLHAYGGNNHGVIAESTGTTPLQLIAPAGTAPFSTNSGTKVANLNADELDSMNGSQILLGTAFIPSGTTVTGAGIWDHAAIADGGDVQFLVALPARAPVALTDANVNFTVDSVANDDDATCTGTAIAPTAPVGKVCIYVAGFVNINSAAGFAGIPSAFADRYFTVTFSTNTTTLGDDMYLHYTWAYHAP